MNKVKRRAMSALLVAVLVLGGIGVYIVRYIEHGAEWATFAANSSVYTSGVLSTGTLTDRSGVVLATANGGLLSGRRRLHRQRRHRRAQGIFQAALGLQSHHRHLRDRRAHRRAHARFEPVRDRL